MNRLQEQLLRWRYTTFAKGHINFIAQSGDHARIFYTQGDGTTGDVWTQGFYQNSSFVASMEFFADSEAAGNGNIRFKTGGATTALTLDTSQNATFAGNIESNGTLIDLDSSTNAFINIDRGTSNNASISWRNAGSSYFNAGIETTNNDLWSLLHTCGSGLYFDGVNMRLGFGESSPDSAFHIKQTGADFIDLERTSVGTYRLAVSGSDNFSIYDVGAAVDRLVITSEGQIYNRESVNRANTAFGYDSGNAPVTTGSGNTTFGYNTGHDITTGCCNTLIGRDVGANITTGAQNVGLGQAALNSVTTALELVAIGYNSMTTATTSSQCTAVGTNT